MKLSVPPYLRGFLPEITTEKIPPVRRPFPHAPSYSAAPPPAAPAAVVIAARILRRRCAGWIAHGKTGSLFRFLGGWYAEEVLMDFFFGAIHSNALRFRREVAPVRTAVLFLHHPFDRPAGTGAAHAL